MTTVEIGLMLFRCVLFHLLLRCSKMVVLFLVSFRYTPRQSSKNCFRIVGDPKHETVTTSSVRMAIFSSDWGPWGGDLHSPICAPFSHLYLQLAQLLLA